MDALESSPVKPGDLLAGKYRVEGILGAGGMGVVVAAQHVALDRRVAVKLLLPESLRSADLVARFAREARALSRLTSEHVTRVIDVGALESGAPYLVMEYLDGRDLSQIVKKEGALPPAVAVDYVLQACEAIAEAHAHGVIHRDLKPANLFVAKLADGSDCVKVLDFGISKLVADADPTATVPHAGLTSTHELLGSPLYMSPEQLMSSRDVDARVDIWALGVVLHELVAGSAPFEAISIPQLCTLILNVEPPPLSSIKRGVPQGLDAVVLRCLAKEPEGRYPNLAALAEALAPFGTVDARTSASRIARILHGSASAPAPLPPAPGSTPMLHAVTNPVWSQTRRESKPKRSHVLGGIVAATATLLAGAAVIAGVALRSPHSADAGAGAALAANVPREVATETAPPVDPIEVDASAPETSSTTTDVADASAPIAPITVRPRPKTTPSAPPTNDINLFETQK